MSGPEDVSLAVAGREPTTPAQMETAGGAFVFRPERWIEQPQQVSIEDHGNAGTTMWLGHPAGVVNDFEPRPLWGLRGGRKFTVLDARMHMDHGWGPVGQRYEASHLLDGAFVDGPQAPVAAARYAFSRYDVGWLGTPGMASDDGLLETWHDQQHAGLTWTPTSQAPLGQLAHRFPTTLTALLQLWTDRPIEVSRTEVRLPNGQWYPLVPADEPVAGRRRDSALLDLQELDLQTVAAWVDLSGRLGPIPHIAVHTGLPVQAAAQTVATALESLHRRLKPGSRRFPRDLSKGQITRAKKAARDAAVASLAGAVDEQTVRCAVDEALGHIDEPTYADRLRDLLPEVNRLVPGLLGPDLQGWISTMKEIRNVQSHGSDQHDVFGEDEISRYYVHESSGRWALKILLLRQLVDADRLEAALRGSDRFQFALANLDRERLWSGFSAYNTFTRG